MAKAKTKLDPNLRRFAAPGLSVICHGQECYPVDVRGEIDLPRGATWYADLVAAGELVPVEDNPDDSEA
jgi:hypothetical protein